MEYSKERILQGKNTQDGMLSGMNTLGKEYSKEGLLEGVLEGKIAIRNQEYSKEGFFI